MTSLMTPRDKRITSAAARKRRVHVAATTQLRNYATVQLHTDAQIIIIIIVFIVIFIVIMMV